MRRRGLCWSLDAARAVLWRILRSECLLCPLMHLPSHGAYSRHTLSLALQCRTLLCCSESAIQKVTSGHNLLLHMQHHRQELVQVHYLSASPTSLAEVLLTGGIPPNIDEPCSAKSAYTRLFR